MSLHQRLSRQLYRCRKKRSLRGKQQVKAGNKLGVFQKKGEQRGVGGSWAGAYKSLGAWRRWVGTGCSFPFSTESRKLQKVASPIQLKKKKGGASSHKWHTGHQELLPKDATDATVLHVFKKCHFSFHKVTKYTETNWSSKLARWNQMQDIWY